MKEPPVRTPEDVDGAEGVLDVPEDARSTNGSASSRGAKRRRRRPPNPPPAEPNDAQEAPVPSQDRTAVPEDHSAEVRAEPRSEPADVPTAAPVVGETSGRFETRLDERNLTRLPAVTADAGAVEGFWLGAASTAGLSHAHAARTGQDSYSWAVSEDASAIVVAVADGLGSRAKTSQVGATLLVRSVCSALATLASSDFDGDDGAEAARRCIDEASVQAFERARTFLPDVEEADLASTLAFGWIPFDPQARRALFGRVGDCGAFRLSGGEFETIFEPDDHPLNVVGGWLPVKEVGELLDVREVEGPVGTVILATDGLVEDIFGSPSVRSWLADRWGPRCSAFRMIDSLRFRRQGSHDDRTALVVWTSNESGDGEPDPAADGEEGPS